MSVLELVSIGKRIGEQAILRDVDLRVASGEFLTVVGPSGCGKSTLLRIVAGLVEPSAGEVRLDGVLVNAWEPHRRDVAMVFQNYALYPHLTVERNLAFPLENARVPRQEIRSRVRECAAMLGLGELLARKPAQLSGGQMQRVALGRAIVRNPRLFLFDEPLSNLDPRLRTELRGEIAALQRRLAITTLYVTHDQAEALSLGSRVCVLWQGAVEQVGTPREVWERPASVRVAELIGSPAMNLLRLPRVDGRVRLGRLDLAAPLGGDPAEILLGVRAHEFRPGRALELCVERVEEQGDRRLVEGLLEGRRVSVLGGYSPRPEVGASLFLDLDPAALHWFDPRTGRRLG